MIDFRNMNEWIVRNTFPIPQISTVFTGTGRVHICNSPWPKHGLYTIRFSPESSKICTIIFPWGKYSYLWLPIGVACSPDIFQANMSKLMVALEFISIHQWSTKGSLNDHPSKLKQVFIRLRCTEFKVNAAKCSFCYVANYCKITQ